MAVYEGVYNSLLQGVSQQTPQEREDGQLGEQINMLSDPVTGLRRRGGTKFLWGITPSASVNSYIEVVDTGGIQRVVVVDTDAGKLYVVDDFTNPSSTTWTYTDTYFKATKGKGSIKTTTARNQMFIVNTEKIPEESFTGTTTRKDPSKWGYVSVRGTQFSMKFTVRLTYGAFTKEYYAYASDSVAAEATPEYVAERLVTAMQSDAPTTDLFNITRSGSTVAIEVKDKASTGLLDVDALITGGYMLSSGVSRVKSKADLLGTLPAALDKYTVAVGNTGNSAYYQYSDSTKTWAEVGVYSKPSVITNTPRYILMDEAIDGSSLKVLDISARLAGDTDNNPAPSFVGYGITGISAYQSRLVLLSGSYVCLSKTTDFSQFMRTSVTELLDDDAIEISSAALSSAQFEYAVPYNKDLVLISQDQQAVIPANATVLTPKTAVIYPSTMMDLSLAVAPAIVGKTMYYTYQRGAEYYQVGEFIPNAYTDAQYYSQNLTDHIPLYAKGVCTSMAASSTNNMVAMCSDSKEVLINQFLWVGEERPLMSFHKWVFPYKVVHAQFLQEFLVLFMYDELDTLFISTMNVQLNQLDDKPVPYEDIYHYVDVVDGVGDYPSALHLASDVVATIYDSRNSRHKEVMFSRVGADKLTCPYNGRIALGIRYTSNFTLTPPFIKDDSGKVIAGARSTIQQLRMTFKSTGSFNVQVKDTMGTAYDGEGDTASTWSETDLGYTWVNSIGAVTIPCRTRLSSTECSVSTTGTTDMNLVSTEYVLRIASKRKRI